jgi:O-antigen/teichoic acid export membrane protein
VGRGAGAAFAIKVAGTALVFANQLILARILGVESYGHYVYAITWVNVLAIVGILGTDTAAVRFVGEYAGAGQHELLKGFLGYGARRALSSAIVLALVFGAVVVAIRERLDPSLVTAMLAGAFLLPAQVGMQLASAVARGFQRIVLAQLPPEVLRPLLFGGGFLAVHLVHGPQWSAGSTVAWNVAITVAIGLAIVFFLRRSLAVVRGVAKRSDAITWRGMALPVLLIAGFNLILSQTDTIMLGMLRTTTEAGIYAIASRLASLVAFMLVAAGAVAAPMIASYHVAEDRRRTQRLLTVAARIVAIYAFPVAGVLALVGRWLLGWFGEPFEDGYAPMLILIVGQVGYSVCGLAGTVLVMTGHQRAVARVLGVAAVANVLLNASSIPFWGSLGAAGATTLTMIVWNVVLVVLVRQKSDTRVTPV